MAITIFYDQNERNKLQNLEKAFINKMKTETEIEITLWELQVSEALYIQQEGFILRFFLACSEVHSKPFKIQSSKIPLQQKFIVRNIFGDELQVWFQNTKEKIIAVGKVSIQHEGQSQISVELCLNQILFARLSGRLNVTKRQIEKIVYLEPDEQLLKKQEDPEAIRKKKEQQERQLRQQEESEKLAKQEKKHLITKTYQNVKEQPFS